MRAARGVILCGIAAMLGCGDPTAPLPAGARPFTPEAVYREWWSQIEKCSGVTGNFENVSCPSAYFVDRCGAVINGPGLEQAL